MVSVTLIILPFLSVGGLDCLGIRAGGECQGGRQRECARSSRQGSSDLRANRITLVSSPMYEPPGHPLMSDPFGAARTQRHAATLCSPGFWAEAAHRR